ncbi:uncharacterized protein J4E92_010347 [Alternaria infectoria]|uniref:uncharacterized protein n=1 Tax=Alternaria infectoria TaxID=45303 RepID=UPI00221F77AA|nr:uncharacterized protein J4E92_010347 [Alternaria infectoria]KAI4911291.1 hypothetical protein J4E92_010347 [Alternaria infectoria]
MAQSVHSAVTTYKQKRFDTAALEAMKAYDARVQIVPVEAKLNGTDKAIIAKNPRQFNFSLWSGLPNAWIEECFGEDLGKRLVKIKLIKVELHPVEQPPVPLPPYLDVQIAEAAGFHRAMNIWSNLPRQGIFFSDAQSDLRRQAAKLADLLAPYNIEDPSSLPGKFSGFQSGLRCPNRLSLQTAGPRDLVPQISYYDEFLNILNRS